MTENPYPSTHSDNILSAGIVQLRMELAFSELLHLYEMLLHES